MYGKYSQQTILVRLKQTLLHIAGTDDQELDASPTDLFGSQFCRLEDFDFT